MEKGIAFFDLDGTVTSKDTFMDFIIFCRGKWSFYSKLAYLSPFIILYILKLYPSLKMKEKFFQAFLAHYKPAELEKLGKSYSANRLPEIVYQEAIERIEWHKKNNHRVIILTASSPIWLSEWCKSNQLELIGTQFQLLNGKYTGKISGKNLYGVEKLLVVESMLSKDNELISYGYGDSQADKYFLDVMNHSYYKPFKN